MREGNPWDGCKAPVTRLYSLTHLDDCDEAVMEAPEEVGAAVDFRAHLTPEERQVEEEHDQRIRAMQALVTDPEEGELDDSFDDPWEEDEWSEGIYDLV